MKKIMALVIMLMMFCQVCVAFTPPDPSRWLPIAADTTDTVNFWIDTKTLRFEKQSGDICANLWVMLHNTGAETHSICNMEMNMNKRNYRPLSMFTYDASGNQTKSLTTPGKWEGVIPGSMAEYIYDALEEIYKGKNRSEHRSDW